MLRVGLTGGLGSGKSTAAKMFAACGAKVFSADEIGRELMQPGEAVYAAIVKAFGPGVVKSDGTLDRPALSRIAFGSGDGAGRIEELNAIVHPATIARQAELIAEVRARDPDAVVLVESALIFETKHGGEGGWQKRFDRLIFVKAPEELKIARFVERTTGSGAGLGPGAGAGAGTTPGRAPASEERAPAEAEARRRLAKQVEGERNAERCDYVLHNDGGLEELRVQVEAIWPELRDAARRRD
jgi:dephospho-CoA kinase